MVMNFADIDASGHDVADTVAFQDTRTADADLWPAVTKLRSRFLSPVSLNHFVARALLIRWHAL